MWLLLLLPSHPHSSQWKGEGHILKVASLTLLVSSCTELSHMATPSCRRNWEKPHCSGKPRASSSRLCLLLKERVESAHPSRPTLSLLARAGVGILGSDTWAGCPLPGTGLRDLVTHKQHSRGVVHRDMSLRQHVYFLEFPKAGHGGTCLQSRHSGG